VKAHRPYRIGEIKAKAQAPSCGRIREHKRLWFARPLIRIGGFERLSHWFPVP
jgi:hypothetical protein